MSDRVRLICIVLTILCIFAVLAGRCMAAEDIDSLCEWTKAEVLAMMATEQASRAARANTNYGASYIPNIYPSENQYQEQAVVNKNINRNTVIIEISGPYYYYHPVYRNDWSDLQLLYLHNRNTNR